MVPFCSNSLTVNDRSSATVSTYGSLRIRPSIRRCSFCYFLQHRFIRDGISSRDSTGSCNLLVYCCFRYSDTWRYTNPGLSLEWSCNASEVLISLYLHVPAPTQPSTPSFLGVPNLSNLGLRTSAYGYLVRPGLSADCQVRLGLAWDSA